MRLLRHSAAIFQNDGVFGGTHPCVITTKRRHPGRFRAFFAASFITIAATQNHQQTSFYSPKSRLHEICDTLGQPSSLPIAPIRQTQLGGGSSRAHNKRTPERTGSVCGGIEETDKICEKAAHVT